MTDFEPTGARHDAAVLSLQFAEACSRDSFQILDMPVAGPSLDVSDVDRPSMPHPESPCTNTFTQLINLKIGSINARRIQKPETRIAWTMERLAQNFPHSDSLLYRNRRKIDE